MTEKFWESRALHELTDEEWESLCDGCAQCCRLKFQDEETDSVASTSLVCRLLNLETRRCTDYPNRHKVVRDCISLDPDNVKELSWLPQTCAYRLIAEGKPLENWHPLISGTFDSVRRAGVSVTGQVISAANVHPDDLADHVLKWVKNPTNGE